MVIREAGAQLQKEDRQSARLGTFFTSLSFGMRGSFGKQVALSLG